MGDVNEAMDVSDTLDGNSSSKPRKNTATPAAQPQSNPSTNTSATNTPANRRHKKSAQENGATQ
jgi:hypothetical protein